LDDNGFARMCDFSINFNDFINVVRKIYQKLKQHEKVSVIKARLKLLTQNFSLCDGFVVAGCQ
jgi:hypothetical protein